MLPEDAQQEIVRRRLICSTCPLNSSNAVANGYKTDRFDEHCTMCGCTITRKTSSLSSNCGIDCCNPHPEEDCSCKPKGLKEYNIKNKITLEPKWRKFKTNENE
jgi:hypothetical protein